MLVRQYLEERRIGEVSIITIYFSQVVVIMYESSDFRFMIGLIGSRCVAQRKSR